MTDTNQGPMLDTRLRVLSWNMWFRFGPWEERQSAITATLQRIDADLIGLQESWEDLHNPGQPETLAEKLGFHHVYGRGFQLGDHSFGNAILSRWPITRSEEQALPAPAELEEKRLVVLAEVDGPRGPIQMYNTHLNWRLEQSHVRQQQVKALCEFINDTMDRKLKTPPILTGDFNAEPDSDEIRMMTGLTAVPVPGLHFNDAWRVTHDVEPGFTWSNENPYAFRDLEFNKRIDYVFAGMPRSNARGIFTSCAIEGVAPVDGVVPSDHYGVLAELVY